MGTRVDCALASVLDECRDMLVHESRAFEEVCSDPYSLASVVAVVSTGNDCRCGTRTCDCQHLVGPWWSIDL